MKPEPGDEAQRWLEQAKEDLKGAKVLLDAGCFHLVCFLAQQVAEKALKAFLYAQGEELVYGHSIEALVDWAARHDQSFHEFKKQGALLLDSYYVASRYPNAVSPGSIPAHLYDRQTAEHAFKLAERTVDFAGEKLKR